MWKYGGSWGTTDNGPVPCFKAVSKGCKGQSCINIKEMLL